jgi:hypothetical protein
MAEENDPAIEDEEIGNKAACHLMPRSRHFAEISEGELACLLSRKPILAKNALTQNDLPHDSHSFSGWHAIRLGPRVWGKE